MPILLPWIGNGSGRAASQYETTPTGSLTVTASATPHTVGPWGELVTATTYDSDMLYIEVVTGPNTDATATGMLLTIGIGAAASEQAIVSNLNTGSWTSAANLIALPVRIPSGSRIAAQVQSVVASKTIVIRGHPVPLSGGLTPGVGCTTYGAVTASSRGANIAAMGTNTWGSWSQVVATTTRTHRWILATPGASNASISAESAYMQIGVGAAASEKIIIPYLRMVTTANESLVPAGMVPHRVDIPSGSRLAARGWATGARTYFDVCLHCFD